MISITVVRCVEHCNNTDYICACGWMMGGMSALLLLSYDHKTVQSLTSGWRSKMYHVCSHKSSSIAKLIGCLLQMLILMLSILTVIIHLESLRKI